MTTTTDGKSLDGADAAAEETTAPGLSGSGGSDGSRGPAGSEGAAGRTVRQWVALAVGVAVLVTGCVIAGIWQWNRHVARDAAIAIIEANYAAAPVPLAELLPEAGAAVSPGDVWRSVTVRGHYVPEATVLLRNRPVSSQAAFHVLVPFVTDQGTVLVINRGWLNYGQNSSEPDSIPAPPAGQVEVVVRLRADEPAATNGAPPGQVQAINTAQVLAAGPEGSAWADGLTYDAYGALASENPAAAQTPRTLPVPDTDPRSHLSYAFQWWVFALGGIAGFVVLVRRERRETAEAALGDLPHPFAALAAETAAADGTPATKAAGGPVRAARRPARKVRTEEEVEDDLIDSGTTR